MELLQNLPICRNTYIKGPRPLLINPSWSLSSVHPGQESGHTSTLSSVHSGQEPGHTSTYSVTALWPPWSLKYLLQQLNLPDESILVPVPPVRKYKYLLQLHDLPDESTLFRKYKYVLCYNSLTSLMSPSMSLSTLVRMSANLFLLSSGVKCLNSSASDPRKAWGSVNFTVKNNH